MLITDKINGWLVAIKNAFVALISISTFGIASTGVYNSIHLDEVSLEEIKVPSNFEEEGYKSDITTIRILDNIKKLQSTNSSAKDRVSFNNSSNNNQSTTIELAGSGIDLKTIQMVVRDTLGIVTAKISGEITAKKIEKGYEYRIVIRRTPENLVLVDFKTMGTPEEVINQTSIKILEETDPHIAAAYYWSKANELDALRMIDVVLGNNNPNDDKFSLNLRAFIHLSKKRYELAQKDIDKITSNSPDFIPLLSSKSWMAREKGDFTEALNLSEDQIRKAPEKWWGYMGKALALQGLKRDDEATEAFLKVVNMRPEIPNPYLVSGRYFINQKKYDAANFVLRIGTSKFKDHHKLNLLYADALQKTMSTFHAESIYKGFLNDPKLSTHALIGIGEILKSENKSDELKSHLIKLKKHVQDNPIEDSDLKYLGKRLAELSIS